MWRDIFLANREPVVRALEDFAHRLAALRRDVAAGDAAALDAFLTTARARREAWLRPANPDPAE
jgi:Prephenate dehydrogenase